VRVVWVFWVVWLSGGRGPCFTPEAPVVFWVFWVSGGLGPCFTPEASGGSPEGFSPKGGSPRRETRPGADIPEGRRARRPNSPEGDTPEGGHPQRETRPEADSRPEADNSKVDTHSLAVVPGPKKSARTGAGALRLRAKSPRPGAGALPPTDRRWILARLSSFGTDI
jgi:hypothetical protein